MLEEIIKLIFAPAAIVAAFVYIFQKLFEKNLSKDIAKYKNQLDTEFESAKSRLENELKIQLFQYQTNFSLFHQKQASLTAELYKKLVIASKSITNLVKKYQPANQNNLNEKKKETSELWIDLSSFFDENRIYFDESICEKIDSIIEVTANAFNEFDFAHTFAMQSSDSYKPDETGLWPKAANELKEKLPPLKKDLENFLRIILKA
jgi:hypothetical protein